MVLTAKHLLENTGTGTGICKNFVLMLPDNGPGPFIIFL